MSPGLVEIIITLQLTKLTRMTHVYKITGKLQRLCLPKCRKFLKKCYT